MDEDGWITAARLDEVPEGTATRVSLDGLDLLLTRHGERVFAVANRCTHQGAPLHRGPVRLSGSLAVVTCPVHGSRFALDTGQVLRGPAMAPIAAYETRVAEGEVQIRDRA